MACWNLDVLEDVLTGWNGKCEGLDANPDAKTLEACEVTCKENTNCAVWQFSGVGETANPDGHCDQGVPLGECLSRDGFKADGGQRLKHGDTKTVKSSIGVQVMNLKEFKMISLQKEETAEMRCQRECYSTYSCGVWQYGENGCWIEAAPNNLHSLDVSKTTQFAKDVKAGEFIEHFCPPKPPAPEPTNWPLIIGLIVGGVLLLGAILAMVLKKKPKVKKTRAVKIAAPEPAPAPMMFIPQPTVLVQQPSVVYQQPSVVYEQQPLLQTVVQQQPSVIMQQQPSVVMRQY